MKFEQHKENIEKWAKVRGIYEQSTEAHQQAKALEEIGEYLTAETDEERMDAIGDIAVCIVNAAYFDVEELELEDGPWLQTHISYVAQDLCYGFYNLALSELRDLATHHGFLFDDCLAMAWNEIKDRKGMMVDGKYVKWDNLNDEQKDEFNRRNG